MPSKSGEWFYLNKKDFILYFLKEAKPDNSGAIWTKKHFSEIERQGQFGEDMHEKWLTRNNYEFEKEKKVSSIAFNGRLDFYLSKKKVVHEIKTTKTKNLKNNYLRMEEYKNQLKTYIYLTKSKYGELVIFSLNENGKPKVSTIKVTLDLKDRRNLDSKEELIRNLKRKILRNKSFKNIF